MKHIQIGKKEISFEIADFSSRVTKDNPLYIYGVIFSKDTKTIIVSNKAPEWYQILAATHECICQVENEEDEWHCVKAEESVLEMIDEVNWAELGINLSKDEIRESYIKARIIMFEECIERSINDGLKVKMSHTLEFLRQL